MSLPPATPNPCDECPWVRTSFPGHLGPHTAEEWLEIAHADGAIACHKTIKRWNAEGIGSWDDPEIRQCRGAAIFRENVCKSPRDPEVVTGPYDEETVFAWNDEFIAHHARKPNPRKGHRRRAVA